MIAEIENIISRIQPDDCAHTSVIWLTQGKYAICDNEDYDYLTQWKWHVCKGYAYRAGSYYLEGKRIWCRVPMHRAIINAPSGSHVDHINTKRHDNRKSNLRFATIQQNGANRKYQGNSSGFKGVRLSRISKNGIYYRAHIKFMQKTYHLGTFLDKEAAARAYDAKAVELFGEYAATNQMLGLLC